MFWLKLPVLVAIKTARNSRTSSFGRNTDGVKLCQLPVKNTCYGDYKDVWNCPDSM